MILKGISTLVAFCIASLLFAQESPTAKKLINEGVAAHDRGDYEVAVNKYDQALSIEPDNPVALSEKGMTLLAQKKIDECIRICEMAIKAHPKDPLVRTAYVTLGTAYEEANKPKNAIRAYDDGIKYFPEYYYLYFNKGITLSNLKKPDEAIECMKQSLMVNPAHPGFHSALARLELGENKNIPAVLAACRFLTLEPQGKRALSNLDLLRVIFKGNVVNTDEKGDTNISVSADLLAPAKKGSKDDFNLVELNIMVSAGLDLDSASKNKTQQEKFKAKLETVFKTLQETQAGKKGFFWDYYVPYFIELQQKGFLETFSFIALVSSGDPNVTSWLRVHPDEVKTFMAWSKDFTWHTNKK